MTASNDTPPPDTPDDLGTIQTSHRTYQLIRKIGRGGCGNVFEAEAILPLGLRRRLAIKFMADKYAGNKQMILRFAREARTGMKVTEASPNLVTTYDFGECPERGLFLAMQLIEGPRLSSIRKAIRGDLPLIWRIAWDVLAGLGHLHGYGLVHRDVSLANVLLAQDGMVKLADFGLTSCPDMPWDPPRLAGVPQYWAPELHLRLPATEKSDLYAVGIMLYELITGESPYGDERDEIFERMRTGPPPSLPDDVPDVGKQLVRGLLEKDEELRLSLASAIELLCDVPRADNDTIAELADAWNSDPSDSPEGTIVSRSSLELMRAVEAYNLRPLRPGSVDRARSWVKHRVAPVAAVAIIAAACLMFFLTRGEQPNRAHAEAPPLPLAAETFDICPPVLPATTPDVGPAAAAESDEPTEVVQRDQKKRPNRATKRRKSLVETRSVWIGQSPGRGVKLNIVPAAAATKDVDYTLKIVPNEATEISVEDLIISVEAAAW